MGSDTALARENLTVCLQEKPSLNHNWSASHRLPLFHEGLELSRKSMGRALAVKVELPPGVESPVERAHPS